MRSCKYWLPLVFFLLTVLSHTADGAIGSSTTSIDNIRKISTVNLLVPLINEDLAKRTIKYTLMGYNGCYEWFSTQPQVLKVEGISEDNNKCHPYAEVALASNKEYNNIIWVIARDKETNDVLKCESRVSRVQRIEIMTKLRTIDVGDVEVLEVLGYDKEGNVFSTLEGMIFEWNINTIGQSNLKLVSLKDSTIKTTDTRKSIESSGYQSDIITVRGLRTGQAVVSVMIKDKGYEQVTTSVTLHVIEHFIIYPDYEIYVLPYSDIHFKLALIKSDNNQRSLQPVALPSSHHLWEDVDPYRASIDQSGILKCKGTLGPVKIRVKDTQSVENVVENTIHIVKPAKVHIEIKEFKEGCWEDAQINHLFQKGISQNGEGFENAFALIKDKEYYIRVVVYDSDMNLIHIGSNVEIQFALDSTHIHVLEKRRHELRFKPTKTTLMTQIQASLGDTFTTEAIYKTTQNITVIKDFSIVTPISILKPSKTIRLPLLGSEIKSFTSQQTFKLYAIGGSGRYEWVSRDLDIATVGREAVVLPKSVGKTVIEVRDLSNGKNLDEIEVEVSLIDGLNFMEGLKEIVANSSGSVNIYAVDAFNQRYSNCSFIPVQVNIQNPSLVKQIPDDLNYEQYIDYLHKIYSENRNYEQLMKPYADDEASNVELYRQYIQEGETTAEELTKLFRLYKNYGLCRRVVFKGDFRGDTTVSLVQGGDNEARRVLSSQELRLRVYDGFSTLEPALTYKTDHERQVILSYHSSFTWNLEGGPEKWEDSRHIYNDVEIIEAPLTTQKILRYNTLYSVKSRKSYHVECVEPLLTDTATEKKSYDYTLKLTSQNEPDPKLPDPVKIETILKVSCKNPSSVEVYILKGEEDRLDANTVQGAISETFTIRNNQDYYFQTWAFDELKRPFYNFSTLKTEWQLTPSTAGQLAPVSTYGSYAPGQDQVRRLFLTATDGEVILRSSIKEYDPRFLVKSITPVYDETIITIKGDIELEPSRYVLYYNPQNSFDIHIRRGSGDFSVSVNDSSVVRFAYDRASHTIRVTPLKIGYAKIIVEDHKLVSAQAVTCDIVVAGIDRVELSIDTELVELGHTAQATVDIYDDYDNKFSPEDLSSVKIDFQLDTISDRGLGDTLKITAHPTIKNVYIIEGKVSGDHRISAVASYLSDEAEGKPVRKQSSFVSIHVFSKLQSRPPTLVLAPGCLSAIEIVGGPSETSKHLRNAELIYRFSNPESVIIQEQKSSSLFSVEGKQAGDVEIIFEVKSKVTNKVYASVVVPVKIGYVDGVEILGMLERKIHIGAQARLIAATKINNQIIRAGLCRFQYQWTSKQDTVLQIHQQSLSHIPVTGLSLSNPDNVAYLDDYNFAVNASALSTGVAEIQLKLITAYPGSSSGSKVITNTIKVTVIDPLSIDLPTYIGWAPYGGALTYNGLPTCNPIPPAHPALLLLPPNTDYQLKINNAEERSLQFSIPSPVDNTKVVLSPQGSLSTLNQKGKVTVLVEDNAVKSEFLMVNVLITDVYSIFVEDSYRVITLPSGANSTLKVHLQDSLGRSFPAPSEINGLPLSLSISNRDAVDGYLAERGSLLNLKANAEGVALVSIYLTENPAVYDIFLVVVGAIITPASPINVHEGGYVKFAVTSSFANNVRSSWYSEDSRIAEIDPATGRLIALEEGRTNIQFSDAIQYVSKVNVFKVNQISLGLNGPAPKITNYNLDPNFRNEYEIPFKLYSNNVEVTNLLSEGASINNNLIFECDVSPRNWVTVSPVIKSEGDKQIPVCVVRPVLMLRYPEGQHVPTSITITPRLVSKERRVDFSIKKDFTLDFSPMFRVVDPINKQITLNRKHPTAVITVQTNHEVEVNSSPELKDYIRVDNSVSSAGTRKITIQIPSNLKRTINSEIEIEDKVTGQVEKKSIYYQEDAYISVPKTNPLSLLDMTTWDIILLVIIGIIAYSFIRAMNGYTNKGTNMPQPISQPHNLSTSNSYNRGLLNSSYNSTHDTPVRSGLNSYRNNYPERDTPRGFNSFDYSRKFD